MRLTSAAQFCSATSRSTNETSLGSRIARLAAIVMFLAWGAGQSASAATYQFTFAGSGVGAPTGSIQIIASGLSITGVANGTGALAGASLAAFHTVGWPDSIINGLTPTLASTSATPYFSAGGNTGLGLQVGSTYYQFYGLGGGERFITYNAGAVDSTGYPSATIIQGYAIASESLTPAPAPLPGAGWLSWLLVAGAAMYRKRRDAVAFIAGRYSLVKRKIAGTAHATVASAASAAREGAGA
jgi:hypothetical protein